MLFRKLALDMKDVKPTQLLTGRRREAEGNPDFSTREQPNIVNDHTPMSTISESTSPAPASLPAQLELPIPSPTLPPLSESPAPVRSMGTRHTLWFLAIYPNLHSRKRYSSFTVGCTANAILSIIYCFDCVLDCLSYDSEGFR